MEQLSFNQNLAYAPVRQDTIRPSQEARVIGSVSLGAAAERQSCLLYTSPSPRDRQKSRMPSSA